MLKECGQHSFSRITKPLINKILNSLKANGAIVRGNNPWRVDTNNHGVILDGSWNEEKSTLFVRVRAQIFLCRALKFGKLWSLWS